MSSFFRRSPARFRREHALRAARRARPQAPRDPDGARDRRRRGDGHRHGLDRHRLQQQHGAEFPELRRDARPLPEVRPAFRPGRPPPGRGGAAQGPHPGRRRSPARDSRDARGLSGSATSGTTATTTSSTGTRRHALPGSSASWRTTPRRPTGSSAEGRFINAMDVQHASDVMVLGEEIREKLFPREDPLDKRITLGRDSYRVIGVFEKRGKMFGESQDNFVVIPISTFDRRFPVDQDRGKRRGRPADRDGPAQAGPGARPHREGARRAPGRAGTCPSTSRTTSGS